MKIKKITITEQYEGEKTREFQFTPDQGKSIFDNAAAALRFVKLEDSYFDAAGIEAEDDPDIYTHEDYPEILNGDQKEYLFSWWGKNYNAVVEISVIVEE